MRGIPLGLICLVVAGGLVGEVLAGQIDADDLKRAFELGESCKQKCKKDSIHLVRLALPKGKVGFLITKTDQDLCRSGGCSTAVVVVSGDHFMTLKEGRGITKTQALLTASDWTATKADPPTAPALSPPASRDSLHVDGGKGRDIRGLRVGMRQGHLPLEFNSLGVIPSAELAAAELTGTCLGDGESKTCVNVFFDALDPERTAYAIQISNLRLGQFRDPGAAENVIIAKYGPPHQSSRDAHRILGSLFAPVYNYMIWDNSGDFTKNRIYGLANLSFTNPVAVERRIPGYQNEGTILIAEIVLKIPENTYYATLVSVDVKTAFKVYRASNQKMEEIRSAAKQREFDQMPPPRF